LGLARSPDAVEGSADTHADGIPNSRYPDGDADGSLMRLKELATPTATGPRNT
jgi:hypothetical protein